MQKKYRLITRDDFDGLACAVFLKKLDLINDILFVHPRDMQHGKVKVSKRDISTNLPYVLGVYMAFDHHKSESKRTGEMTNFICSPAAPSAAQVLYDYFKLDEKFPNIFTELLSAVNKADSAHFSKDEILKPEKWNLLHFVLDPKTGFSRFHDFKIPRRDLLLSLIGHLGTSSIDNILQLPDLQERVMLYNAYAGHFYEQLQRCATVYQHLIVLDLRQEEIVYPGNRFMIYALYPKATLSLAIENDTQSNKVTFSLAKSILNKASRMDVGALMTSYGGGGHTGAGTCQSEKKDVEEIKMALIERILLSSKRK